MNGHYHIPVKCIETGEVWESGKACAKAIGVNSTLLYEHIRFNDPISGKHYIKNYD